MKRKPGKLTQEWLGKYPPRSTDDLWHETVARVPARGFTRWGMIVTNGRSRVTSAQMPGASDDVRPTSLYKLTGSVVHLVNERGNLITGRLRHNKVSRTFQVRSESGQWYADVPDDVTVKWVNNAPYLTTKE